MPGVVDRLKNYFQQVSAHSNRSADDVSFELRLFGLSSDSGGAFSREDVDRNFIEMVTAFTAEQSQAGAPAIHLPQSSSSFATAGATSRLSSQSDDSDLTQSWDVMPSEVSLSASSGPGAQTKVERAY